MILSDENVESIVCFAFIIEVFVVSTDYLPHISPYKDLERELTMNLCMLEISIQRRCHIVLIDVATGFTDYFINYW